MTLLRLFTHLSYHLSTAIFFAVLYFLYGSFDQHFSKGHEMTFIDSLYFSITTQTTVGYGGIIPNNNQTRLIAGLQMVMLLLLVIGQISPLKKLNSFF